VVFGNFSGEFKVAVLIAVKFVHAAAKKTPAIGLNNSTETYRYD
jgi:hypothetical protein